MGGKTVEATYSASIDRLYPAMVRAAAELGYTILSSQPEAGVLSFNTGRSMKSWTGQDLSATALAASNGSTKVVVGGSLAVRGAGFQQIGSWGEKQALSSKFLEKVRTILPSIAVAPKPTAGSLADELSKLASLQRDGILTAAEFEREKARILKA